ncbi:MAG: LamG domain-containing protein [Saprospiraceae bacterium]|nr:LamG domain-containing protein [Candidatus Vicinibacter proximus]MBL7821777.1 LamG domain-containing protein [Saprospiraceae bacterium]MCC6844217.1 LamG domain-containing protein [Saprospiraceae bacterium]HRG33855.1 LamG domain-containing protein [Saprospiraceae bacterium]
MKKLKLLFLLGFSIVLINSCKEDDVALPPIGGFNNANEVGKADLLAHFPLDGNGNERISGAAPASTVGTTFTAGAKGQCAQLNAGYLAYNPIAALTANTASYSISAWVNVANNGSSATCFVTLTRPTEWAGNFNLMAETGWFKSTVDTLVAKGLLISREGNPATDSWQDSRCDPAKGGDQAFKGANTWSHLVITWDAATSNFLVFGNGKKVSNPEWENRLHAGSPVGDLVFNSGVSRVVLGAFGTNVPGNGTTEPWQVPMTGKLDEVRIWKKALSAQEIDALYQLEKAGR